MTAPFVLASASPRRRRLLSEAGFTFAVVPSLLAEREVPVPAGGVRELPLALARAKAAHVVRTCPELRAARVLAADTVVLAGDEMLGIPRDDTEARAMLERLEGSWHEVMTALALREGDRETSVTDTARVKFRPLSPSEIANYLAAGESADKAGAYAYQERGGALVEIVLGDPETVIGLPRRLLGRLMAELEKAA